MSWLSSSGSRSSSSGRKGGEEWTNKLYFDGEADKYAESQLEEIQDSNLGNIKGPLIRTVHVYETPHSTSWPWQSSKGHTFLVFKDSDGYFWSLDKDDKGFTIQKSKKLDALKDFKRWEKRKSQEIEKLSHYYLHPAISVGDLFQWMQLHREQWRPGGSHSSCYDFTSETFHHLTGKSSKDEIPKPDRTCGDGWKPDKNGRYLAHFIPEADSSYKSWLTEDELIHKLKEVANTEVAIERATAYKVPLYSWQVTNALLYHLFIVLKTDEWWWSIEKNSEGLTIQRSKNIEAVRDRYRQANRISGFCKVQQVKSATGKKTINDLISWLQRENWLLRKYNVTSSNCQHFGDAVYDYVT